MKNEVLFANSVMRVYCYISKIWKGVVCLKSYSRYARFLRVLSVLCLQVFLFAGITEAAPELILKFAGQSPSNHPASILMKDIAKEIGEKTNGRIEVKVYPANQLGDYTLVFEEQIRGTIDMSNISVPSQFDPRLELVILMVLLRAMMTSKKSLLRMDGFLIRWMT